MGKEEIIEQVVIFMACGACAMLIGSVLLFLYLPKIMKYIRKRFS
jgi:hypothetical protein